MSHEFTPQKDTQTVWEAALNEEVTFGPDYTETLSWLADLAKDIRSRKDIK